MHWEKSLVTVDKSFFGYGEKNICVLLTNFSWFESLKVEPNKI